MDFGREFIDEILSRTDIVELIGSFQSLHKKGSKYWACCPFHEEKTASFSVDPNRQYFHCYGCSASGDAITFLSDYKHLKFIEAIEELAQRAGLELPKKNWQFEKKSQTQNNLFHLTTQAENFYQQQLNVQNPQSEIWRYIQGRELSSQIIERFHIGYAPKQWDSLLKLFQQQNIAVEQQLASGLLIENTEKNKIYDRFRNRLMFSIRDRRGRTIGFGGRVIDAEDTGAKYINSPETALFVKGRELYGLYELTQKLRNINRIVVVEGYMDVVMLAQHGIDYAVATLGTATTEFHLKKLFNLCSEVVFCFDGDKAGKAAAWKALTLCLQHINSNWRIRFLFLPNNEDPDSFVRSNGKEAFEQQCEKALGLSQFFFDKLMQDVDLDTPDGRAHLMDAATPYLSSMPLDSNLMKTMKAQLNKLTGLSMMDDESSSPRINYSPSYAYKRQNIQQKTISLEYRLIEYLLNQPNLSIYLGSAENYSHNTNEYSYLLLKMIDFCQHEPHTNTARLLNLWPLKEEQELLKKMIQMPLIKSTDTDLSVDEFQELVTLLRKQRLNEEFKRLQSLQAQRQLNQEEQQDFRLLLLQKSHL